MLEMGTIRQHVELEMKIRKTLSRIFNRRTALPAALATLNTSLFALNIASGDSPEILNSVAVSISAAWWGLEAWLPGRKKYNSEKAPLSEETGPSPEDGPTLRRIN